MKIIGPLFFCLLLLFSACRKNKLKRKGCTGKMEIITASYNSDGVSFYVPNAFTPDGDGINDVFYISGIGFSEYELIIYKRNKIIYKQNNSGWDGVIGPSRAKSGIYNYKFIVTTLHNEKVEIEGEISLIGDLGTNKFVSINHCTECLFGDMIDPYEGFVYLSKNNSPCK